MCEARDNLKIGSAGSDIERVFMPGKYSIFHYFSIFNFLWFN